MHEMDYPFLSLRFVFVLFPPKYFGGGVCVCVGGGGG